MTLFKTRKVEIWEHSPNKYGIVIYRSPRLAKRLNSILSHYEAGSVFTPEDEPVFYFYTHQIKSIADGSTIMRKILAQTFQGRSEVEP